MHALPYSCYHVQTYLLCMKIQEPLLLLLLLLSNAKLKTVYVKYFWVLGFQNFKNLQNELKLSQNREEEAK